MNIVVRRSEEYSDSLESVCKRRMDEDDVLCVEMTRREDRRYMASLVVHAANLASSTKEA